MIIVRVELHSAVTRNVTEIARMRICNIGGTRERGDYRAETFRGRSAQQLARLIRQRATTISDYQRLSIQVWHLVARALVGMGYAGKSMVLEKSDLTDEGS
jgi:hypothetical protein